MELIITLAILWSMYKFASMLFSSSEKQSVIKRAAPRKSTYSTTARTSSPAKKASTYTLKSPHLSWILDEKMRKHPTPNTSIYEYFLEKKQQTGPAIWHIDYVQLSLGAVKESPLHGLEKLTLLYPTDNMAIIRAKPAAKIPHYDQNPVYSTKSLTDMSQLIEKEKKKIETYFKDVGLKSIK